MANNQAFKIKNGLSAKRYLQNSTAVSASDVDLSTGSHFTKTLSANTTFTFSNPPASGKATGFALEVTGANVTVGYDLANASYDSVSFNPSSQSVGPRDLFFKSDGSKMYILDDQQVVYQYSLSTAFDISTASYDSISFSVSSQDTSVSGLFFGDSGTKMYVIGVNNDYIYQYTLSSAWNLSTASYSFKSFSLASQDTIPYGVGFNENGAKMFILGRSNGDVFQYTLSTAWDVSTASYDSVSFDLSSQVGTAFGIAFKPDGTKMFIVDFGSTAYQYSLSTAFDLSTALYDNVSFSLSSQGTRHYGLRFNSSGSKMITIEDDNNLIYQYSTAGTSAATVAWPSSVKWSGATAPDAPASGEKDVYVFVTTDGGTTYYGKQAGDAVA